MINRILVPLDGTSLSEGVVPHVRRLLKIEDAEVTFLRVLKHEVGEDPVGWQSRQERASAYLRAIDKEFNREGARAAHRVVAGDPAEEILLIADSSNASLIAMTTHGRSGPERWLRGSVAERILRHSRVPVLMVNPETKQDETAPLFRRILLPLDGSELSEQILPLAVPMAESYGSELILFHCEVVQEYPDVVVGRDHLKSQAILRPYLEDLQNQGLKVRAATSFGLPADEILKAAKEEGTDLIALTTHGRTGLSRWLFGSVAEGVLRHCTCPVLLKRTAAFGGNRNVDAWEQAGVEERLGNLSPHAEPLPAR